MSPKANIEFMVLFEFIGVLKWLSVIDLMAILPVASHTNRFGHIELECSNAAQVRQATEKKSSISPQVASNRLCSRMY